MRIPSVRTPAEKTKVIHRSLIGAVGAVTAVAAISALFQFGSRNDAPINQVQDTSTQTTSSRPAANPNSGFKGITTLPKDLQASFPEGVRSRIATCIGPDASLPTALDGTTIQGYTCLLPLDMGANVVVTVAQSPETVTKIREIAPSLNDYAPMKIEGAQGVSAFTASVKGMHFLMILHEEKGTFQEFSCNGVRPEETVPCMDELKHRTNAVALPTQESAPPPSETSESETEEAPTETETSTSAPAEPAPPAEPPAPAPAPPPAPAPAPPLPIPPVLPPF